MRLKRIAVTIGEQPLWLEVANTASLMAKGLSGRTFLESRWGMLFDPLAESDMGFWMRGTWLDLNLAFVGSCGTVQEIHRLVPHNEQVVRPSANYRWAVEAAPCDLDPGLVGQPMRLLYCQ